MNIIIFFLSFIASFWITTWLIYNWNKMFPSRCEKGLKCGCKKITYGYTVLASCENKEPKE